MSRSVGRALIALSVIIVAAVVAWDFIEKGGVVNVFLAAVLGLLMPASIGYEWWSAKRRGDDTAMLAVERVAPAYVVALVGGHFLGGE